jgi:two-component system, OmpR family, aerobic respiration control sensor histidine kinase ArcB
MFTETIARSFENDVCFDYQSSSQVKRSARVRKVALLKPISKRKKILVVDASRFDQVAIKFVLERMGYDVDIAATGESALSMYKQHGYSLILMDIKLPDIDGITVTEKIRLEEKGSEKRIPIIAYTFSSERKYKKRCIFSGMDSFTRKPIPVIELESIIGNFLFS